MTADAVGGVWRYAIDLGRALARRHVNTTIAVMGPAPSEEQRREAERAGLPLVDHPYALEWMNDPWADIERAGRWLLTLERTLLPDIVHLNGYVHATLPWASPVLVVAHSCVRTWWRAVKGEPAPPRFDRYSQSVRAGLEAADAIVAPTAAMLRALCDEYGSSAGGHVHVIANGSEAVPRAREAEAAQKHPFIFTAARAWDEAKNVAALCEVAPQLPWPVYVAGDTREPGTPAGVGVPSRMLGRLAGSELTDWYRRASIYALPARYEPFGLSVLEAASAHCALVLGDIGSLREIWDGAAVFVPPDDRRALAAGIQRLIDDTEMRDELSRRAAARASTLTIDRSADRYAAIYQGLAA